MIFPRRILAAAVAALLLSTLPARAFAQAGAPAAPAAAPAEPPPPGPAAAEFKVLFERITDKLKAGEDTPEKLVAELKDFDALIAKYEGEKTNDSAMLVVMKARLYLEVFQDNVRGLEILKTVKAKFPDTEVGKQIEQVIAGLEKQIEAEAAFAVGKPFPGFAEKDLDGKPLTLDAYKGKVVLVDFWATWCGPCVQELPNVLAAYEKYHGKGFDIIGISLDKDREALTKFVAEKKMTWAHYFDGLGWQNKLSTAYGITAIPATFLLDREGRIVAKDLRGPALEAKLAELLP